MGRKATEIRKGNVLDIDGELWRVNELNHNTPGNWRAMIHMKMRSLKSGNSKTVRYGSGDMLEVAFLDTRKCQYLYKDPVTNKFIFMDQETYDQHEVDADIIGDEMQYIMEEQVVDLTFYDGNPVSLDLPGSVTLKITETEPAAKGNTVSNLFKRAVCETGLEVKVPLHIATGEIVKISTQTGEFMGRSKE